MIVYGVRRLGGIAITLVAASFIVYASVYVSPGSPESVLFGGKQPTPEVRAAVREHLGLDQGFATRYWHWLTDVFSGDLGTSLISQQAVADRIAHPLMITLALVAYAALLISAVGHTRHSPCRDSARVTGAQPACPARAGTADGESTSHYLQRAACPDPRGVPPAGGVAMIGDRRHGGVCKLEVVTMCRAYASAKIPTGVA